MFSNAHKCVLGAIAAAGLSIGSVPAEATSVIFSHNGSPGPVPVTFNCSIDTNSAIQPAEDCTKDWTAFPSQPHVIEWGGSQGTLVEDIINNTGIPWTDYHWEVIGPGNIGKAVDIDVDPALGMVGSMPIVDGVAFWLFFTEPFTPNTGDFVMTISFDFDFFNGGIVTIRQYPTVPEPATLALMGLGLAGIGYQRRRKPVS